MTCHVGVHNGELIMEISGAPCDTKTPQSMTTASVHSSSEISRKNDFVTHSKRALFGKNLFFPVPTDADPSVLKQNFKWQVDVFECEDLCS